MTFRQPPPCATDLRTSPDVKAALATAGAERERATQAPGSPCRPKDVRRVDERRKVLLTDDHWQREDAEEEAVYEITGSPHLPRGTDWLQEPSPISWPSGPKDGKNRGRRTHW